MPFLNMKKIPFIFLFFLVNLSNQTLANNTKVAEQLKNRLQEIKTLEIIFEQQVLEQNGRLNSVSSGKLYLSRPNKLRWEYTSPQKQTIIADGTYIWIYDEDLEQASSSFQRLSVRGTPAEILLNPEALEKKYNVEPLGENKIILTPKKTGKYRWLSISFTKNGLLEKFEMENKLEQRIRFNFYNEKRNTPLDKKLFIFEPPEGTDILDDY